MERLGTRREQAKRLVVKLDERVRGPTYRLNRLVLEITESVFAHESGTVEAIFGRLSALGVRMDIDDFGVGFSALSYLKRLPVTGIKIDRSFVTELTSDLRTRAIVEAITTLGQRLGLSVVAEGIEDAETLRVVQDLGVELGQGYHMARPMDPAAFRGFVDQRRTPRS